MHFFEFGSSTRQDDSPSYSLKTVYENLMIICHVSCDELQYDQEKYIRFSFIMQKVTKFAFMIKML